MNPIDVSDVRSNMPEQILHAVKIIGRSKHRLAIFKAIYHGKKKIKTVDELESALLDVDIMNRKVRVLQEAGKLAAFQIVNQVKDKKSRRTGYEKIPSYSKSYKKIIDYVINPQKAKKISTKRNHVASNITHIRIYTGRPVKCKQVTVDDIDSFHLVRGACVQGKFAQKLLEKEIKKGFQKIIGESGNFKDWGGEQSDLYSTKIKLNNRRIATAIAFKGRATKGELTPEKMGKRGTQIERLFQEPAQVFLIVYQGQISPRILSQMQAFALGKSMSGQSIYYGIIDRDDLERLVTTYKDYFNLEKT